MADSVYILLAEGFEEIEAVTPADILRRLGLNVLLIGVSSKQVKGSHGIEITSDATLNKVKNEIPAALILPGGMPGAKNLDSNADVRNLILKTSAGDKIIAAICAAPMVIGRLGLLNGKNAVCFPGFEEYLTGAKILNDSVVRDGNIITAKGPGAAAAFGFEIGAALKDEVSVAFIKRSMQYIKQ
jgi:4-methyl-5(b-hydroxyethyl)-thiazole monophosphate biosynthesis